MISTNGFLREAFFDARYEYGAHVAMWDDGFHDYQLLPLMYELDSREEWTDPACWEKAKEMLKVWTYEPEPAKAKEKKESKPKKKSEIDVGKAQALRDAGWTITKIADELGTSKTMIHAITTKPAKKKQYENEWAEHEPDLSLQTRIDMGEEHLEDA